MCGDTSGRRVSTRVVQEVAAANDTDPAELAPPFATVIDPDALDAVFRDGADETTRVVFRYAGCEVTVDGTGDVDVRRLSRA